MSRESEMSGGSSNFNTNEGVRVPDGQKLPVEDNVVSSLANNTTVVTAHQPEQFLSLTSSATAYQTSATAYQTSVTTYQIDSQQINSPPFPYNCDSEENSDNAMTGEDSSSDVGTMSNDNETSHQPVAERLKKRGSRQNNDNVAGKENPTSQGNTGQLVSGEESEKIGAAVRDAKSGGGISLKTIGIYMGYLVSNCKNSLSYF